jgi:MarR family transcriptional regulator for hemolysin
MRPAEPDGIPVGLRLTQTARTVGRAFDAALADTGGSLPVWLVLLALTTRNVASQRELAEAVGIKEATLTHHLNAMETADLISRRRDPANRRIHIVALTPAGDAMFLALRSAAIAFDQRLRAGISEQELAGLRDLLTRLAANAEPAAS